MEYLIKSLLHDATLSIISWARAFRAFILSKHNNEAVWRWCCSIHIKSSEPCQSLPQLSIYFDISRSQFSAHVIPPFQFHPFAGVGPNNVSQKSIWYWLIFSHANAFCRERKVGKDGLSIASVISVFLVRYLHFEHLPIYWKSRKSHFESVYEIVGG